MLFFKLQEGLDYGTDKLFFPDSLTQKETEIYVKNLALTSCIFI